MDELHTEPVAEVGKETPDPWWRGRVEICWLAFGGLFAVSSLVFFTRDQDAVWLRMLGCLSGSLLGAPLIVYLAERLFRVDLRD